MTESDRTERSATGRVEACLRLLRAGGFLVQTVHYGHGFADCLAVRHDELGVPVLYTVGVADSTFDVASTEAVRAIAERESAALLLIADEVPAGMVGLRWPDFVARMGGDIPNLLPLDPHYGSHLIELGRGRRPDNLPDGDVAVLYEFHAQGNVVYATQQRIALSLGSDIELGGRIERLDLVPAGGYAAWLFQVRPRPRRWQGYLRMPLIQKAVADSLGTRVDMVSVGMYWFEPEEYSARIFRASEVTGAVQEAQRVAAQIAALTA